MLTNDRTLDARINSFLSRKFAQHDIGSSDTSKLGLRAFMEEDANREERTERWNTGLMSI